MNNLLKPNLFKLQSQRIIKFLFSIALVFTICIVNGQTVNKSWKSDLSTAMDEFLKCEGTGTEDLNVCYQFIGKSLKTVYRVDDFYSKKSGRYLTVDEIADYLNDSEKWTKLGYAYEQEALNRAQNLANENKPAIAIYLNSDKIGHAVVILPGSLHPSGSWGSKVPNSASFFTFEPKKSYIGKGLSYAFGKNILKDVILYGRTTGL